MQTIESAEDKTARFPVRKTFSQIAVILLGVV